MTDDKYQDDDFQLEGFDVNKLEPQEKAIYERLNKQFRDAYLKKTSALAQQRRKMESEMEQLKQQLTAATSELQQFYDWWQREGQYLTPAEQRRVMAEEGMEHPNVLQQEIAALRREFQQAAAQYQQMLESVNQRNATLENALRLQNELWELRWKHRDMQDFDPMKVLKTAQEKGLTNLELAFNIAYGDALKERELNTKLEERLAEERERLKSEQSVVETRPTTTRYAPPSEPRTYGEASESLLGTLRSSSRSGPLLD